MLIEVPKNSEKSQAERGSLGRPPATGLETRSKIASVSSAYWSTEYAMLRRVVDPRDVCTRLD